MSVAAVCLHLAPATCLASVSFSVENNYCFSLNLLRPTLLNAPWRQKSANSKWMRQRQYCISSCVHSWLYCTSFVLGWLCGEEGGTHINIILQRHTWRPIPAICCGNSIQRRHVICELTLTVSGRIIRVDIRVHIWTRHNTYCWTLHQPRFSC